VEIEIDGRKYCHAVGAIGWPFGDQPAFALLAGEQVRKRESDRKVCRWLAEHEGRTAEEVIRWCIDMGQRYGGTHFYADTTNKGMVDLAVKMALNLTKAPYCDDPNKEATYRELIKQNTLRGVKGFFFGKSVLPIRIKDEGPAFFALGYVLKVLEELPPPGGGKVDIRHGSSGGDWPGAGTGPGGDNLNSPAGHYTMDDSPTSQKWGGGGSGGDW
jgi:hypothetical protein